MPVLKFNQCDYDCHDKRDKRGTFRVYCKKVDPKCVTAAVAKMDWSTEKLLNLMADIRLVIGDTGSEGATLDDIRHIFKDRAWLDIQAAVTQLLADAQIQEISRERYVVTDPRIVQKPPPKSTQRIVVMRGGPGARKLQTMAACLKQNNIEYTYEGEAATSGFGVAEITITEQNVPKARECGWRVSRRQWAREKGRK